MASATPDETDSAPIGNRVSLEKRFTFPAFKERLIRLGLLLCALLSIATTFAIVYILVTNAVYSPGRETAFFEEVSVWDFLTDTQWSPMLEPRRFGVLPLLLGTLQIAVIAGLIGLPIGLLTAIYLSEYATPRVRGIVKPVLEILAGVPTVVYGYFALVFITPYMLKPLFAAVFGIEVEVFNALSAGIVVGVMIIPMVSSLSEDALRAVPNSLREAGYALGSTKFDVSTRIVLPAASSGIMASFLLAVARAVGETMAVTIAAGQRPSLSLNPLQSVETMTAYIVNVSLGDTPTGTIEYKSLYAVGLTLFLITLTMNVISQAVLRRYREVYQ